MALTTFQKIFWALAALGGLWAMLLSMLTNPWLQRHALYAHKLHSAWWQNLNEPEKWGYLKNQVRPFNISTPDGEVLYAWHVLPLQEYHKHEKALLDEPLDVEYLESVAYRTLREQPSSRVVVNFHGNAGHIGQGWRTDGYRALAAGQPNLHVIAFDYRGFGYSTGFPTEEGLITDGVAIVDWALERLQLPPSSVALVGQSLGTAVASAVAERFASERGVEFAGVVLIAAFSDMKTLLLTYAIGGWIPIFSPLNPYPAVQNFFKSKVVDDWPTGDRIDSWIRSSKATNLILIHARDDFDIHWTHSNTLFHIAANATSEEGLTMRQVRAGNFERDLGVEGMEYRWVARSTKGGARRITQLLLKHGGHNRVVTYPAVSKSVMEVFA